MKKTLITTLACILSSAIACAATSDPIYSWTWTSTAEPDVPQSGWSADFNYTTGNDYASFGGTDGAKPWSKTFGDFNGSFTFDIDIRRPSEIHGWKAVVALYSGNNPNNGSPSLQLTFDNNGNLLLYSYNFGGMGTHSMNTGITYSSIHDTNTWTSIRVVSDLENDELALYVNGTLAAKLEDWTTTATLTGAQFGTGLGGERPWNGSMQVNNIAFYNSAVHPTSNIPEPATATLSLLALAGLAARRRRM